jgi:thiamine-monophosphate kinase
VADAAGVPAAELAATGGEDYELCACLPAGVDLPTGVTAIGRVVSAPPGLTWLNAPPGAERWRGYAH